MSTALKVVETPIRDWLSYSLAGVPGLLIRIFFLVVAPFGFGISMLVEAGVLSR